MSPRRPPDARDPRKEEARDENGHLIRELHGVTLVQILEYLVERIGWQGLASRITINCFRIDPSIKSSLVFAEDAVGASQGGRALHRATVGRRSALSSDDLG